MPNCISRLSSLCLLLFCLTPFAASAQTQVQGAVNVDTVWTLANSPYLMTADVAVQIGSTLTIEPGVVVLARGGDTELIVRGGLVASGGAETPVTFGPEAGEVTGSWEGLRFEAGSTSTLQNVVINYADYALEFATPSAGDYSINDVTIHHPNTRGVAVSGGSLNVTGVRVNGAQRGVGIYATSSTLNVTGSRFTRLVDGVYAANCTVTLDHVIVAFTTSDGVEFRVTGNPARSLNVRRSTFYSNEHAIDVFRSSSSYSGTVRIDDSIFGLNTSILNDSATHSSRPTTFSSFNRNIWWGDRITSGSYVANVPANGSTSLRYNALLADPENGDFAPTDRSPARYWSPDAPAGVAGAVPFAGAPTGAGVHGFWYVNHTFAAGTITDVAGDIVVTEGVTMTFQPAARLQFAPVSDAMNGGTDRTRGELRIEGTLEADGTNSNPVVLTSARAEPLAGDWYGIIILADTEAFNVSQVDLGYATRGVSLLQNDHIVAGSEIHHCSQAGIWIEGGSPNIEEVELYENAKGIRVDQGANVDIVSMTARDSSSYGVESRNSTIRVDDSIVRDNGSEGFHLVANSAGTHRATITHSTIAHNGSTGIWMQRSSSSYGLVVTLDSNSITHNSTNGVYDAQTHSSRYTTLNCLQSNVWGNGTNFRGTANAANTCFGYNPLYADAEARNYEPTVHSPNRRRGTNGSHVGALPHVDAVGPQLMGYLWEDYTFTDDAPYHILGDVVVPAGVTVTFEPGAQLLIAPNTDGMGGGIASNTEIRVLDGGTVTFDGSGAPIVFRPESDAPTPGMWYGLRLENSGDSFIDNADISFGSYGINAIGPSAPEIEDTITRHHNSGGLHFTDVTQAPLVRVLGVRVVGDGNGTGVYMDNSSGLVRSTYITHHTNGLYARSTRNPGNTVHFINNTVVHHTTGISYQRSSSSYALTMNIFNNVVAYNTSRALADTGTHSSRWTTDHIRNNNFYANASRVGQPNTNVGNITDNPLG